MIPKRIEKEIEEMCSRISEPHREGCREALTSSWKLGGTGVIEKGKFFQYNAQWFRRRTPGSPCFECDGEDVWMGCVEVILEVTRSVVQTREIEQ